MSKSRNKLERDLHEAFRGFPRAALLPGVFFRDPCVYSQGWCRVVREAKYYELKLGNIGVKLLESLGSRCNELNPVSMP